MEVIKKMYRMAGVVFACLALSMLFNLFFNIRRIVTESGRETISVWYYIYLKILPWFYCVLLVVNLYGVYWYMRFFKSLHRSLANHNADQFNRSFRYIYRNLIVFLCVVVTEVLINLFSLLLVMKLL